MTRKETEKQEAIAKLREILKPGDRVYTVLRHVSRSGMFRLIDLYYWDKDGAKWFLTGYAAKAMGYGWDQKRGGLRVPGCGMDMGFHVVYSLGRTLWPDGTLEPHGTRNGAPDRDGGYALRQEWI